MPTLTIAKRELRAYWNSPIAYVVICVSLFLLGMVFFNLNGGFWEANRASLSLLFRFVPLGLGLIVVPVVTMRLVAEEKQTGTLEMLITLPVTDRQVIMGKFLAAWALVLTLIAASALYPIIMFGVWNLGSLDSGPVFSSYVGLMLYSASAVSIGLFISTLTESQVIAFFITIVVLVVLNVFGGVLALDILPDKLKLAATFISFDERLRDFFRGMINIRDVVYFLSITGLCLAGSIWGLERRKWA